MSSENIAQLDTSSFNDALRATEGALPLLVDFWAPWCGPCKALGPILDELATDLADSLKVAKVNIDDEGDLAARFGVRAIPTLLIFKNGELAKRLTGLQSKETILAEIKTA
jgi:thioredoxin 1